MTMSTQDLVLAGLQPPWMFAKVASATPAIGRPMSLWGVNGFPGIGAYSASLAGVALSSSSAMVTGQLPHTDPSSGNTNLARLSASASQIGVLMLCDRLWHNGGFTITSTGAQTISSVAFPARDNVGSVNGLGVQLGLEISATVGAATPTVAVSYTNSGGSAGRATTTIDTLASGSVGQSFFRLAPQAGDIGVQSVQTLTLSTSWLSGTMNLVAYRPLAALELPVANVPNAIDYLTSGFPQLFNGAVPFFLFLPAAASSFTLTGSYVEAQG